MFAYSNGFHLQEMKVKTTELCRIAKSSFGEELVPHDGPRLSTSVLVNCILITYIFERVQGLWKSI
jgi:hypothetical protein